ncbi:MAG: 3-deoxy-7-phosphoheptulonate synthase, partial [candidate division FCPU426 bacterium]
KRRLRRALVVDCSHANSNKDYNVQPLVLDNVVNQILEGNSSIVGVMIESNIHEGSQKIDKDRSKMKYGVSVTDACISWETTERVLRSAASKLAGFERKVQTLP